MQAIGYALGARAGQMIGDGETVLAPEIKPKPAAPPPQIALGWLFANSSTVY